MKPQHLLASVTVLSNQCFLGDAFSPPTQGVRVSTRRSRPSSDAARLRMETHDDPIDARALSELEDRISSIMVPLNGLPDIKYQAFSPGRSPRSVMSVEEASMEHGMPWETTFGRSEETDPLLYMPFWKWQLDFMSSSLTNLHPIECSTLNDIDVSYNENKEKRARIVNHCYASNEYRKIRMTYYDAGDAVQVFNSVWYPDAKYNLPVLGIDLLSFNRKKYLAIVDFQPLHPDEDSHSTIYEHILKPIKEKYDNLKGRMSSKFYDETQFFSKEMLFARFEDGKIVNDDLFPAFKSYVETHVDLVKNTPQAKNPQDVQHVFERQQAYDTYSADRDPAAGLFAAMFGKEWAEDFIYDFLFSLSERSEEGLNLAPPMFGGPPPSAAKGGSSAAHGGAAPKQGEASASSVASSKKDKVMASK
mmetsp:Transcript_1169/g.2702  ORF Transcript_1169/g.2702 Transcript_1169/m.2702 type:complete len:418 (+) Transcript_1169:112-1365(+)